MKLKPSAYAPYADPEDYIMSCTDQIWEPRGMGQIRDFYAPDIKVHGAYGTIIGAEPIVLACLQKNAAYPRRAFTGEDVIWEAREENSFISAHRILNCGRQEGYWHYGPPTFRHTVSRNVALCLVRGGVVVEEWVVRDEWAVVEQSGHDVAQVATSIALAPSQGLLGGTSLIGAAPGDPLVCGVSGARPAHEGDEDEIVLSMIDQVWNGHLGNLVPRFFDRNVIIDSTRRRTHARWEGYKDELDHLFGPFPDAQVAVYDVALNVDPFYGTRVSVLWMLRGTYSGVPLYGPITHTPVEILGCSQFLMRGEKIVREWRIYDEIAVWSQIISDQRAGQAEQSPVATALVP